MSARFHEWAWGYITVRTVCGQTGPRARNNTVFDLANIAAEDRCKNCERMRGAIGTAAKRQGTATPADGATAISNGAGEIAASEGAPAPADLTESERDVVAHAVGWESRQPLYRNHYCASEGHHSWGVIQALVARGLMRVSRKPSDLSGGDTVFSVTALGIAALKQGCGKARSAAG